MYNPSGTEIEKCCWVPNCLNIENTNYFKTFYPLPTDEISREIWLARVGKPMVSSIENVYLCEEHFKLNDLIDHTSKGTILIPYFKMSQVICRLCMSIVPEEHPYHVLSNTTPTDIPPDLKNTTKLAIVITPEPLQNIVKFCMPELMIQAEPIPLICQNCFKWIWKLYLFKTTCIEVDKRLRGNLSIETYGKMVLCRACPQTFGTNFIVLVEQSSLGMFLTNMFSTKYSSKIVPLRLCTSCYEILKELLEFQLNCHAVEEKMKCHMALTQSQEIVRAQVTSPLKSVDETTWKNKDSSSNEKPLIEDISIENFPKRIEFVKAMMKYGIPLKNKVHKSEKDEIWKNINQELQGKGILCNVLGLKNTWASMIADIQKAIKTHQRLNELQCLMIKYLKMDQQTDPVSSVQHQPLINDNIYGSTTSIGITPNLENTKYSFDFRLYQQPQWSSIIQEKSLNLYEQERCRGPKLKLQILDDDTNLCNNVSTEINTNLETSPPSFETAANKGSIVNSTMGTSNSRSFFPNTQDKNRSENSSVFQMPVKSRKANRLSNILKPDINKKTDISENNPRNVGIGSTEILSVKEQLDLLEMMKTEYKFYLKEVGNVYSKLPFKELLERIIERHKEYQNYSPNILHSCWRSMEESSLRNKNNGVKTLLQEKVLEFLEFECQHRGTKVHPKLRMKMKKYKTKNCRQSDLLYQDKIDLVEAAQREYNALTNEEKKSRSIWKNLMNKIHKKGFKNWSHMRIYTLWSRLKVSAVVHEKNSNDLVDRELWKLLQQFNLDKRNIKNDIRENREDTITMETNKNVDKNRSDTVATQIEPTHEGPIINDPTSMPTVKIDKKKFNRGRPPKRKLVQLSSDPTSKPTDKIDKRKFNIGRIPNRKLVFQLSLSEKVDFLDKIEQEFNNKPAPWTIILARLYKLRYKDWDKSKIYGVWNQLKVSYIKCENNCDVAGKKMWDLLQKSVQPQRKTSNNKTSSTSGCSTMGCGKDSSREKNIHPDKKNGTRKKTKGLSEEDKLILFKNIKKEYLAMANKKDQNISRPWKAVIQRVHHSYYKNIYPESKVFSEWSKIRKSAALHENTNNMSEVDWKVVRLMKIAKTMKECKKNVPKNEISCRTEPIKNIIEDAKIENEVNKQEGLQKQNNDYVDWCYKKKLDLITAVKSYGREVFRKCHNNENDEFWLKIKKDFQNKGYKYSEESLKQHWEELHRSANMAWADQKVASELDDIIIKFMKSVIIFKKGNGENNENIIKESPMAEKVQNDQFVSSVDKEQSPGVEASDEDSSMLEDINDRYVSLEDIRNYIPVVPSSEIIELSSDDETVIDFECKPKDIENIAVMIEKSKVTVEKQEIEKLKVLMENVGVMKDVKERINISEILSNTINHQGEMVEPKMAEPNMAEDHSVIVIESDDE